MPAITKTIPKKKTARAVRVSNSKAKQKSESKKLQVSVSTAPKPPVVPPGYVSFTVEVWRTLWRFKSVFVSLSLIYALLSGLFLGLASQSMYSQLGGLIRSTSSEVLAGNSGKIGETGLLLLTGLSGGMGTNLGEAEQLMAGLLLLVVWLVTVWMLRALLAGRRPRLRDGFYNAGAPIIPTVLLGFLFILQLVPAAIAMIGVSAALPAGFISSGIGALVFWVVVFLLVVLSLYWVTSTLMAMVVVTLPGMYPMQALETARKLVGGRRLKIILRILWLFFATLLAWGAVMIPIILFDAWIKGVWGTIDWIPLVPLAWLLAGSVSLVWVAGYIYLLYRKVVEDDAASA